MANSHCNAGCRPAGERPSLLRGAGTEWRDAGRKASGTGARGAAPVRPRSSRDGTEARKAVIASPGVRRPGRFRGRSSGAGRSGAVRSSRCRRTTSARGGIRGSVRRCSRPCRVPGSDTDARRRRLQARRAGDLPVSCESLPLSGVSPARHLRHLAKHRVRHRCRSGGLSGVRAARRREARCPPCLPRCIPRRRRVHGRRQVPPRRRPVDRIAIPVNRPGPGRRAVSRMPHPSRRRRQIGPRASLVTRSQATTLSMCGRHWASLQLLRCCAAGSVCRRGCSPPGRAVAILGPCPVSMA